MKIVETKLKKTGIECRKNVNMSKLSTFKVGGKAALFVEPKNEKELSAAVTACVKARVPYMAVGSMSNVIPSDGKINIVFLSMVKGFKKAELKGKTVIKAGAGMSVNAFNMFAARHSLKGAEFLAGIPGTIGGAVYMNAGAFGKNVSMIVSRVYAINKKGESVVLEKDKCRFSYRKSVFQKNGFVITAAEFKLKKGDSAEIKSEIKKIIKLRHEKHPWQPSAGSFFKNSYPSYTAGKVIEAAGLKGKSIGGAAVSEKHANFIINKGGAKASDIKRLAAFIKKEVYKKFKIRLKEEVKYI